MNNRYCILRNRSNVKAKFYIVICISLIIYIQVVFNIGCTGNTGVQFTFDSKTDCEKLGLQGPVKSISQFDIDITETYGKYIVMEGVYHVRQIDSHKFLKSGNRIEATYYDFWGPLYEEELTYDNDDRLAECTIYTCKLSTENCLRTYYYKNSYDMGRIDKIEGRVYYDYEGKEFNSLVWTRVYEYSDKTVSISSYTATGSLMWRHIQKYNASGMRVESIHYDNSNIIQWREQFTYDSKGNRTEWSRHDSNGTLEWRNKYKFDNNGNEVECIETDSRNNITHKYFYYIDGDDLEKGTLTYSESIELDIVKKKGLDLEKIIRDDNFFDGEGNWEVKIIVEEINDAQDTYIKIKSIEKRIIEYYN